MIREFLPPLPLLLPYCFISLQGCEFQFGKVVLPCCFTCGSQPVFIASRNCICIWKEYYGLEPSPSLREKRAVETDFDAFYPYT